MVIDSYKLQGKLLCKAGCTYVVYRKGTLLLYRDLEKRPISKIKVPMSRMQKALSQFRYVERTLRLEPRIATDISENEIIFSYKGKIYNADLNSLELQIEHCFRSGMNNPLSFCTYIDAKGIKHVLYGEYWPNTSRSEVSIFERDSNEWRKVYSFPPGRIKHIHQIVYEKNENVLWIATGDSDSESGIWKADIRFNNVIPYYTGKQQYRTCFIVPDKKKLVYATDSPIEKNAILTIDNGYIHNIYNMPGPCIFGRRLNNKYSILATSVECDPSETWIGGILHNTLAKGVHDRYCHLIVYCNDSGKCFEICRYKKDWISIVFLFGNIMFPEIEDDKYVYFTGQALEKIDGCTLRINISDLNEVEKCH